MKKLVAMVSLYNAGDFIENRLRNLSRSSIIRDMEIWIVNANSPDRRDHEIPQKWQSDSIKYIKLPERINVYAAWNHIIKESKSKYITNANADDLIAPNGYEKLVLALDSMPHKSFAYPSWYTTATPNLKWSDIKANTATVDSSGKPGSYKGDLASGGVGHFPLWRRSLHEEVGLFDESFKALGDAEWWARCYHRAGARFYWLKEFLACYLWRNGENLWHQTINQDEWDNYHKAVQSFTLGQPSHAD